jgi:hypothetical protein
VIKKQKDFKNANKYTYISTANEGNDDKDEATSNAIVSKKS